MSNISEKLTSSDVAQYYSVRAPQVAQRGLQWRGACPLHGGERDSLSINSDTGFWTCWSACGNGDIVQFEQKLAGGSVAAAVQGIESIIGRSLSSLSEKKQRRIVDTYPYVDEDGQVLFEVVRWEPKDFRQRRPKPGGGYDWSLGDTRIVPYRLPKVLAASAVVIVEGEKDVATVESLGLTATCNPMGAGKWRKEFADYFAGKQVAIIPDQDGWVADARVAPAKQFPGQRHGLAIARSLLGVAAGVRLVDLPNAKDVTDYVAAGGTRESLLGLLREAPVLDQETLAQREARLELEVQVRASAPAEPESPETPAEPEKPAPPENPEGKMTGHADMPANELGDAIMQKYTVIQDGPGNLYEYEAPVWTPITRDTLLSYALTLDGPDTKARKREEAVRYVVAYQYKHEIPWRSIEEYEVPLHNGVLDLKTLTLREHKSSDYLETILPVDYVPDAQCPVWLAALATWFDYPGECYHEKVAALQEFFGYVLMGHARYKKALFLYGKPDTGKSQALNALVELVGRKNTCSLSVEDMDNPRLMAPIKGKLLNCLSELPADAVVADSGFKRMISTGDPIQIDQKYVRSEQYFSSCKHVIAANSLPAIADLTSATHNRIKLIAFNHPVPVERQDRQLIDKFRAELQGILAWSVAGARRLHQQAGEFTDIPESVAIMKSHRSGQNQIIDFLNDKAISDLTGQLDILEIRRRFNEWLGHGRYSRYRILQLLRSGDYQIASDERKVAGWRWKQ